MDEMLKRVLNARVTEVLPAPTPLTEAPGLTQRLGVPVYALLGEEELARGIIAASAGNHAQGVAFASRRRGARCRIVMPRTTPDIKIAAVRGYGAEIDLFGDN